MQSGLGIRPELFDPVAQRLPSLGFLEAHSENYFGASIARAKLLDLREHYPISMHGVGLSLGRADHLDAHHLQELKALADELDPLLVSEHLAWSAYSHTHVPDLLPLPLTEEALSLVCEHIDQMQMALGRQVLVENPSNYLVFDTLQIPEPEFLNELAKRTGCGLLVDVNNVYVSATNVKRDARGYINALDSKSIGQFHLAGFTEVQGARGGVQESVLIDTHNHPVYPPVWELFAHTLATHGARPTLIEWDSDFPEFDVLLDQCEQANRHLESSAVVEVNTQVKSLSESHSQSNDVSTLQADFMQRLLAAEPYQLPQAQASYQHRFWIYQNNVFAALQDYLSEVFPATKGVVGDDFFKQMAHVFIQKSPPKQGNIHLYGQNFVDICDVFDGLAGLVYIPDLIRYEWALHASYYADDFPALDVSQYAQEDLLAAPIECSQTMTMIESAYPIDEIHKQSLPDYQGKIGVDLNQSADLILVCRPAYQVISLVISEDQLVFLKQLQKSENLLQAIEALEGSLLPESLSNALSFVFEYSLLRQNTVTRAA